MLWCTACSRLQLSPRSADCASPRATGEAAPGPALAEGPPWHTPPSCMASHRSLGLAGAYARLPAAAHTAADAAHDANALARGVGSMRLVDGGGREKAAGCRGVSCGAADGAWGGPGRAPCRGDPKPEACRRDLEVELVLNALLVVMPLAAEDPADAKASVDTTASLAPLLASELVAGASGQVRPTASRRRHASKQVT